MQSISKATFRCFPFLSFLLWIAFLSLPFNNVAQAKAVLYDGRDGLNSNNISAIAKDNRGIMWIGTANGLNIFDGYNFTKFQGVLTNKDITSIKVNPDKNEIIVGTFTGIFSIDLNTLTTNKILVKHDDKSRSIAKIDKITYNPFSKEFYYSVHSLIFRINSDFTSSIVCQIGNANTGISNMKPFDKDHMLINNGALLLLNVRNGKLDTLNAFKNIRPINKLFVSGENTVVSDFDSRIYTTSISALKSNTGNELASLPSFKLPYHPVKSFLKGDKLYCLGDNYSFVVYDIKTNKVDIISKKYPDAFEGKLFYSLFVDENNIAWIGTNKGMIKVEDRAVSFTKILYNLPERISSRKIYEDDNDDIYVCSYAGLIKLSKDMEGWQKYITSHPNTTRSDAKNALGNVYPLCIVPRNSGSFYIGFDDKRLLTFDKNDHYYNFTNFTYANSKDMLNDILDMALDENNMLWLAGNNGIATYDPKTGIAKRHINDAFSIGNNQARIIYNDKVSGSMLVGSTSGLYIFDIKKGLQQHFSTNTIPALNNNDILFVSKDIYGDIWMGTNGGGINILSADLKRIRYIRKQDGLSSEIVYSILPETNNVKWISTFNGLDRYQLDKKTFTNFFEEDGISSNEFNQNSFLKTRDGRFYFGSINGVTTFVPQQFIQPSPFKIYFAGISKWDNKSQSMHLYYQNLLPGSSILKSPSDLLVELHFGCTDYSDPQRNSYSYRVKEISNNWISLEDRHSLNIGGLPYGKFTLEIKAVNARGATSSNVLLYYLNIEQPFYKTWWFFGLILLFIIATFYGAYLIKSHNFKNVLHLRMKIASNLHDEVGSLLTRITMFSDNLRYSKNNEEQRNIKLEKIAILSRNAVASMSDVLWTIDSRNDFAGNLLDRMREQAEEMLFPLGIDVNFVLLVNDLKKHIDSDTRGEVYLIFKEAINNIVKHSNATEVEITYKLSDKHFYLKIENNGIVESISDVSTGQGLNNMKMRAKKIGATIKIERKASIFCVELEN